MAGRGVNSSQTVAARFRGPLTRQRPEEWIQVCPSTGTYVLNPGFSVAVRLQGDHLSTEGQGSIGWLVGWLLGPVPMNPVSPTRFSNDIVGAQIELEPDADGQYRSLTLHQDGAVLKLRRQ